MIDSGKRIVTFMDHDADITSVSYIIDEFSNVFEGALPVASCCFSLSLLTPAVSFFYRPFQRHHQRLPLYGQPLYWRPDYTAHALEPLPRRRRVGIYRLP